MSEIAPMSAPALRPGTSDPEGAPTGSYRVARGGGAWYDGAARMRSADRAGFRPAHRSRYVGPNLVVAAAGSVDHERLVELCARMAAKKAAPPARPARARPPLVAAPPPSVVFQEKDTEQYHVCIGAPGIARSDRRRFFEISITSETRPCRPG